MDNYNFDINALIQDLNRIEKTARVAWINCLDPESLAIVKTGVEYWNQACLDREYGPEAFTDFDDFVSNKIWCLELLVEALESLA